jgi:hypothetical protein
MGENLYPDNRSVFRDVSGSTFGRVPKVVTQPANFAGYLNPEILETLTTYC